MANVTIINPTAFSAGEHISPAIALNKVVKLLFKINCTNWPDALTLQIRIQRSDDSGATWYQWRGRDVNKSNYNTPFGFGSGAINYNKNINRMRVVLTLSEAATFGLVADRE